MKKFILGIAATAIVFGICGTAFGLWIASERAAENSLLSRVERKAMAYMRSALASESATLGQVVTNRLVLEKETFNLPLGVTDSGGGIAAAPEGGVLLIDRMGKVFHHRNGQTTELQIRTPDNGLDELTRQHANGELGEKAFRARGFRFNDILAVESGGNVELFISYSDWEPDRLCYRSILGHVTLPGAPPAMDWVVGEDDWRELMVTEPCLPPLTIGPSVVQGIEAGGRLLAVSDEEVVWSVGVYEHDDSFKTSGVAPYAQREDSDYGRLWKINFRTGERVALARGLRNPQGLTRDGDGRIWVTDHGMRGGDELNVVNPGQPEYNFGWPYVSYGTHYNRGPVDVSGRHAGHDGYDLPLVSFVPSIAPGAALYVENFHPDWDGDVLVGAFRGTVERVHEVAGRAIFVEPIEMGVRTRDMAQTRDGDIVILTDNLQLIFLRPDTQPSAMDRLFARIDRLDAVAQRETVAELVEGCLQCHGLDQGEVLAGPSLHGICGARMGTSEGFGQYSDALGSDGRVWTEDLLAAFIADPQSVVPGTTMAWGGTPDTAAAGLVASLLCQSRGS